jgi:hypothetical protein
MVHHAHNEHNAEGADSADPGGAITFGAVVLGLIGTLAIANAGLLLATGTGVSVFGLAPIPMAGLSAGVGALGIVAAVALRRLRSLSYAAGVGTFGIYVLLGGIVNVTLGIVLAFVAIPLVVQRPAFRHLE